MLGIIASVLSVAVKVVNTISTLCVTLNALQIVGRVLVSIAKALGLIHDKDVTTEELGDKALQAEESGIKPENYKTYEDYVKALEEFEIDPEKSKKWTEEQKIAKGIEIESALLIEKYGPSIENMIIEVGRNPEFFNSQRVKEFIDLVNKGKVSFEDISGYLDGSIKSFEKKDIINNAMVEVEKKVNPDMSESDIQRLINRQKY